MRKAHILIPDFLVATCVAAAFVSVEFDLAIVLILVWFVGLILVLCRSARTQSRKVITARVLTHLLVMVSITTAAALAPGKRIELVLERTVQLEERDMRLSELAEYCDTHSRHSGERRLPLRVYIVCNDDSPDDVVHFPSTRLSLKEFIDTIESQTRLRHSFGGCGNAYTVLKGPAYNFGLSITDPRYRPAPFDQ